MINWQELLRKPNHISSEDVIQDWFNNIAQHLLNNSNLFINNQPHRIVEIEFYYFTDAHQDFFSHCDILQLESGRWYFHKIGGNYKGGTFKGLDLTFGACDTYGGILIRSIEAPDGNLICGPSLCVDYLLSLTNSQNVATLDSLIAKRIAWDNSNILRLETSLLPRGDKIFKTARIGLSLKKATASNQMHSFILRPYRYLTEPRRINKGKVHLILALKSKGMNTEEICKITGSRRKSVEQYINEKDGANAL